jgi:hypothetical protein
MDFKLICIMIVTTTLSPTNIYNKLFQFFLYVIILKAIILHEKKCFISYTFFVPTLIYMHPSLFPSKEPNKS